MLFQDALHVPKCLLKIIVASVDKKLIGRWKNEHWNNYDVMFSYWSDRTVYRFMDWVTFPCMDYVKRGGKMSGETFIALKENAKKYIESYEAVQTLKRTFSYDRKKRKCYSEWNFKAKTRVQIPIL